MNSVVKVIDSENANEDGTSGEDQKIEKQEIGQASSWRQEKTS